MSVLEVRGLTLGYNRIDAVKGIDLDVAESAVVSLIGANGAGKTTTLRGLSGLLKARKVVVLPAPLAPISDTTAPSATSRSMPFTASMRL